MDVQVGDILVMKKEHPCGTKQWLVLRSGMDFRLRCTGCGHGLMLPRSKAEKNIRQILRDGKNIPGPVFAENMFQSRLLRAAPGQKRRPVRRKARDGKAYGPPYA